MRNSEFGISVSALRTDLNGCKLKGAIVFPLCDLSQYHKLGFRHLKYFPEEDTFNSAFRIPN